MIDHHYTIGLDISDHKVRLVSVRQHYRKLVLTRFAEMNLPTGCMQNGVVMNPTGLVQVLRELPKHAVGARWQTGAVHVGLPEQQTFMTTVPVTELTRAVAEKEARRFLPFREEEMVFDIQINRAAHTASVAASRKEIVQHYLHILKAANYGVTGLHCETEAVAKAIVTELEDKKAGVIVVDLGTARTTIVFFIHSVVYFTTSYPSVLTGTGIIQDHLVAALQQIRQYYDEHYVSIAPFRRVLLCGSGAAMPNLVEWLNTALHLPAAVGNPITLFKMNHVLKKMQQPLAFTTAIGLALPK